MANPLESLWNKVVSAVSSDAQMTPRLVAVIEMAVPQGIMQETLYVEVESDFARDMIEQRARDNIVSALVKNSEEPISNFSIVVNPALRDADEIDNITADVPVLAANPVAIAVSAGEARLNPKYTFDNFVIGPSNRFAHAAALAVGESPAKAYNPLFIYGGSGLGKTHLLHAIGHYAQGLFPGVKVRYVSSEEFTNDYINSLATNQIVSFNQRYREVDVLLIDDIQFLGGKDAIDNRLLLGPPPMLLLL
jgi:chromosomal replication initiator protein